MTDAGFPFTDKAVAAVRWLLPLDNLATLIHAPAEIHLLMSNYSYVRELIGTPISVDSEIDALHLDSDDRLPSVIEGVLATTITLFALAMEVFDNRDQALRWWQTPIRLHDGGAYKAPRDWLADPDAATELAARVRRTLSGIL